MTEQEFKEMLAYGREQAGIEFKGPDSRTANKQLFVKVVRAMLSMANRRDGGLVVVGIDEANDKTLLPTGIAESDLATWNVFDELADAVAGYTDPNVNFTIEIFDYEGKKFVLIQVDEFNDIPVLCKKDYPGVLRSGACYVRSRKKPETSEIPTQSEMRDLLELATIKALRKYVSIAHVAGLEISEAAKPKDEQLFKQQLSDLIEE